LERGECSQNKRETQVEQNFRRAVIGVPVQYVMHSHGEFDRRTGGETGGDLRQSDERIRLSVLTALHWDLAVPRDRVQVRVERGWVTLARQVERAYEKSRAEADARMVGGVLGVTNETDYRPIG
jgi:osmotically-inducible protein OsmY